MLTVSVSDTINIFVEITVTEQYMRYSVTTDENKSQIVSIINLKEVLDTAAFNEKYGADLVSGYVKK